MKFLKKISWLIVAFGLIISILVIDTAPSIAITQDDCEQNQDTDTSGDAKFVSANALAFPLSIEINIDPQLFLLATLPEIEEADVTEVFLSAKKLILNKELVVILRRIISPNAP